MQPLGLRKPPSVCVFAVAFLGIPWWSVFTFCSSVCSFLLFWRWFCFSPFLLFLSFPSLSFPFGSFRFRLLFLRLVSAFFFLVSFSRRLTGIKVRSLACPTL